MDKYITFLVLESIARGYNEKGAILKRLESIDKRLVEETLTKLEEGGYVRRYEKGRIFKKTIYELTPAGEELRSKLREEITGELKRASELVREQKYEEAKEVLEPMVQYVPALAALGLIEDLMLLNFIASAFGLMLPGLVVAETIRELIEGGEAEETEEVEVEETEPDIDVDTDVEF